MKSWKLLCATLCGLNVMLLCLTNLIGFGCGIRGITDFSSKIYTEGIASVGIVLLYCMGISYMQFWIRENEKEDKGM